MRDKGILPIICDKSHNWYENNINYGIFCAKLIIVFEKKCVVFDLFYN